MKMLCVSDQIDPLLYSDSIQKRYAGVDIVLSAGDLPLDYLHFIASSLNKPLLYVSGNHHIGEKANNACQGSGCVHVGSKVRREEGLIVAGLGGSVRYNRGPNQFTELQMYLKALKLVPRLLLNRMFHGRFLDVLLTHAPPRGIHDKPDHRGFKAFLWCIRAFRPKYLIHGHIHLYDLADVRRTRWHKTEVINAYGHYLIDTAE
jgi:Icc-related predicted phosphoesterase